MNLTRLLAWVLGLSLVGGDAFAHDFWIQPSEFRVARDSSISLRLRVGDGFAAVAYPRNPAHIRQFFIAGPSGIVPVSGTPRSDPAGHARLREPGLHIIGYGSARTITSLPAERFEAYLREEGFQEVIAERRISGDSTTDGIEAFSRYAKSLVLVGEASESGNDRRLGFALELVSERNPYTMRAGQDLSLRVFYMGEPLSGARLVGTNADSLEPPVEIRTDSTGRGVLRLGRGGLWLIRCVHLVTAPAHVAARWESFWGSLTFELDD